MDSLSRDRLVAAFLTSFVVGLGMQAVRALHGGKCLIFFLLRVYHKDLGGWYSCCIAKRSICSLTRYADWYWGAWLEGWVEGE